MLRDEMIRLVEYVQDIAREAHEHHEICEWTAEEFVLWDDEWRYPVWLSRVVEGIMRDIREHVDKV